MAATSTYSTVACVVFFGLKRADSLSRRSSGTLAMPTCASRECMACASSFAFVRILNSDGLPTCGNPVIPVFMRVSASLMGSLAGSFRLPPRHTPRRPRRAERLGAVLESLHVGLHDLRQASEDAGEVVGRQIVRLPVRRGRQSGRRPVAGDDR